jgi:hypothetical protein
MEGTLEYTFVPRFAEFFESPYAQIGLVLLLPGVTHSPPNAFLKSARIPFVAGSL